MQDISPEHFESLLGQTVAVSNGERTATLEVKQVERLRSPSPRAQPFSLVLREPGRAPTFGQGMLRVDHPQLGSVDLFTVPIGPDAEGFCYEITFN